MFLRRFRSKRAQKRSIGKTSFSRKADNKKGGIFRRQGNRNSPPIEQSLTWTNSEDEEDLSSEAVVLIPNSWPDDEVEQTMTFTKKEVMMNQLNHMMEINEKDCEILSLRQENEELRTNFDSTMAELKEKHQSDLDAKDVQISGLRVELDEAKADLCQVSCVLIQTQHELYEHLDASGSLFSSWLPGL